MRGNKNYLVGKSQKKWCGLHSNLRVKQGKFTFGNKTDPFVYDDVFNITKIRTN